MRSGLGDGVLGAVGSLVLPHRPDGEVRVPFPFLTRVPVDPDDAVGAGQDELPAAVLDQRTRPSVPSEVLVQALEVHQVAVGGDVVLGLPKVDARPPVLTVNQHLFDFIFVDGEGLPGSAGIR